MARWLAPLLLLSLPGCWITSQEQDERLRWWYDISAGYQATCGMLADATVECWGEISEDPTGTFTSMSAGYLHGCGVKEGQVVCWGATGSAILDAPAGAFDQVSTLAVDACARDDAGKIECWGDTPEVEANVPDGTFQRVVVGEYFACALGRDEDLACWGQDQAGETSAPAGLFEDLDLADDHACALSSEDSAIVCWGDGADIQPLIRGSWQDVAVGWDFACGLDWDGAVACFDLAGQPTLPIPDPEVLVRIDAGLDYVCGVTHDGRAVCWGGDDEMGQKQVPHNPPVDAAARISPRRPRR